MAAYDTSVAHTSEQLRLKEQAIELAVDNFVDRYNTGQFEDNKPLLYHSIDSLYQLLRELRSG